MKRFNLVFLAVAIIFSIGIAIPQDAFTASSDEPIIVGVPTSLGYGSGKEGYHGVIMAVEEINSKGGVQVGNTKRKIKLEASDIRDAAPGVPVPEALLGLEKIIMDKKVHAIVVGPYRSEALLAGMDIIAKHKVPMLGTIALTPASEAKIRKEPEKYKYIFRVGETAKTLVGYQIGFMKYLEREFGLNRLFVIHQDTMWARKSAEIISGVLKKGNWRILGVEAYPAGATDYSTGLMKVQASGAQIIFAAFDLPQAGVLVKQWRSMRVPALLGGVIAPMCGPDSWETYDRKIASAINFMLEIGNIPVHKGPASVRFYEAYKKRWGTEIQDPHGSYEALYVLTEAIEKAGTLEPDALVEAIEKTDRTGAIGRIRFDEGHQTIFGNDPTETAMGCVMQWREGGKRVVVYPESIAEDNVELPPWLKSKK
jgi:branched-chain amino acid transport system substrate-binding protein